MTKRDDSEDKGKGVSTEESEEELPKKVAERGEEEDDEEGDDDDDDDEPSAPAKREPTRHSSASAKKASSRRGSRRSEPARAPTPTNMAVPRALTFAAFALAVGGAGGWFGHEARAKAHVKAESAAAPAGSGSAAGPCGAWQSKICKSGGGESSAVCAQAKGAIELLTPSSCEAALSALPATLAKLKAARASCDSLVGRLCKDLPQGSQACTLVKDKTPAFPSQRCDEMLKHYDEVLASLREIDQQGPMAGPQMGGPGGPGGMARPQMGGPGMPRPQMNPPGH